MKLPQLNLRIPEQHHQLIRDIAQRLREHSGDDFGARLTYFLNDQPAPTAVSGDLAGRVADLEETVAKLAQMITAQVMTAPAVVPPRTNAPYPDEVLAQANDLNNQGMTWEAVWKHLGEPGTVNGLRNAVGKRRKRQDA